MQNLTHSSCWNSHAEICPIVSQQLLLMGKRIASTVVDDETGMVLL
nr:hypothetical protein [Cupriavidus taiwanensis]